MRKIAQLHYMNNGAGFRASSLRGGKLDAAIDPFLGIDHAWMRAATFPPHPHAGFSAVSYIFVDSETGISNRDSLGTHNIIQPGGLHWTAAGRGVVHEEVPAENGKTVHMLQIFVNLSVDCQGNAPFMLSIAPEDVPSVQLPGAYIRIPLGAFADVKSPLQPPTAIDLLDISLDDGASLSIPLANDRNAFVMPITGSLDINGTFFDAENSELPVFPVAADVREIRLNAEYGKAKVVFFSGVPLHQEVYWQGSLALASTEALAASVAAYRRGAFGSL